jgi:exoribonuclease R
VKEEDGAVVDLPLDAVEQKLLDGDLFDFRKAVTLVTSPIRSAHSIPCVLVLKGQKTYGRHPKSNKLLYKCVPNDRRVPTFLVPYEIKNVGFSKIYQNLYVTVQFHDWLTKHPTARLTEAIGPVNEPAFFYSYQLKCRGLDVSIQPFSKKTLLAIKEKGSSLTAAAACANANAEDRTHVYAFTIDPEGSQDFDDAFSISETCDPSGSVVISIYISNVPLVLEHLGLWSSFADRISTIYLPDYKRPMLPPVLSDDLCSLKAGHDRVVFTADVRISADGTAVEHISFGNAIVRIRKNFVYDEPGLLKNPHYQRLTELVRTLSVSAATPYLSHVQDSHDVVGFLMILMNHQCARHFVETKTTGAIFRRCGASALSSPLAAPPVEVADSLRLWQSTAAGEYVLADRCSPLSHDVLNLDSYLHITSPIRRLVDIINMVQFQRNRVRFSPSCLQFCEKWSSVSSLVRINDTTRMIRRLQTECDLLHCFHKNPLSSLKTYEGYAFDWLTLDGDRYQATVFLPDLKLTSRVVFESPQSEYSKGQYKLFLFKDEERFMKKVRLQYAP